MLSLQESELIIHIYKPFKAISFSSLIVIQMCYS